ncbi:MAG: GAF domain-containing sensor histidine kinase [Candidatus Omnitrophica bacterium]|nr:GAF domain-containing sensor histidine kinase [Candidatus Omnitrophota bacterium]
MFQLKNDKQEQNKIVSLREIINIISMARDIKELLECALNKTLKALDSEKGSIFLTGDDGKELFLRLAQNTGSGMRDVKKKLGEGVIGKVAMERKGLLVKDISREIWPDGFKIPKLHNDYKTNSFLCVPIATDVKLIGVMSVTENRSNKPYSEDDLRFLEIVAEYIAFKIEKGQLVSELESMKKKVESESKFSDMGKFAGAISHELNSPLDGIIRYVNLALNSMEEGTSKEYLIEAKGGLARVTNIIRSLLELARRKKDSLSRLVDINEVINNSLELLRYQAMYKGVEVKKELSQDLPKIYDYGIGSVFSNIFKNALDAIGERGSISVGTSCEKDGMIKIAISDTGCGIPRSDIGHIFEPFFSKKEKADGVGLGLSICYDIVKRYNGRIDVSSELGQGSRFVIYLPTKQ